MLATTNEEIRIQPEAFELANRFEEGISGLLKRSVAHARQRSASIVVPDDVKAALQEVFAELQSLLFNLGTGPISEIEFSEEEFHRLAALPFRRPDVVEDADDDL